MTANNWTAAAPSPFPPIADYAFLPNGHTQAFSHLALIEAAGRIILTERLGEMV